MSKKLKVKWTPEPFGDFLAGYKMGMNPTIVCSFRDTPVKGSLIRFVMFEGTENETIICGLCTQAWDPDERWFGQFLSDTGEILEFRKPARSEAHETCYVKVIQ